MSQSQIQEIEFDANHPITPEVGMILEGVIPFKQEPSKKNQRVFVYYHPMLPNSKGLIYPEDELLFLDQPYDVTIHNMHKKDFFKEISDQIRIKTYGYLLHSHVYHNFQEGDEFNIALSKISNQGDPMIKIPNYLGFIKPTKSRVKFNLGDNLRVKIESIKDPKKGKGRILILSALEKLE